MAPIRFAKDISKPFRDHPELQSFQFRCLREQQVHIVCKVDTLELKVGQF